MATMREPWSVESDKFRDVHDGDQGVLRQRTAQGVVVVVGIIGCRLVLLMRKDHRADSSR